jgi:mono/diheme cytochrome c family protein
MKKVLITIAIVIVVLVGGFLLYFNIAFPKVGKAPDIKVNMSPENIERGKYLANHVTVCIDCHSDRDWSKYSGPLISGTEGKGGERMGKEIGLPGDFYVKNITPASLKDWTDGEIYRAITSGLSKDGTVLFPIMPYPNFAKLSREDIYAIIAYIRTLKPIENKVPKSEPSFPMSMIMKTIPSEADHQPIPNKSNLVQYGKYLVTAASCGDCHTQAVKGTPVEGMEFAGGREFVLPIGTLRSANITPDKQSGIGTWNEEFFIEFFKSKIPNSSPEENIKKGEYNTIMPWTMYAGMEDDDLKAIFAYLKTLNPVKNKVKIFDKAGV